ncbi:MAG: hypothetical protein GY906_37895 [bacterium]|nr:hypothetical protein [bacterium]
MSKKKWLRRQKSGRRGPVRIDLHVHTGRYSQCAELLDPYKIQDHALAAGVSGVVLTEHDLQWQDEEFELLRRSSPGISIFRGIEVSAAGCHVVVIGIEDAGCLQRGASLEEVATLAAAEEAAVILAHPYRDSDPDHLPLHLVDAIEVASTSFTESEAKRARALATRNGKHQVASSDAHALVRVGWAWTEFPKIPANETELARLIRNGNGKPVALRPFPG